MFDAYCREIHYLRLSVTDRCNYRCTYCMPPEGVNWLDSSAILTDEEIVRLLFVMGREGVSRVRLTGGEPLVRPGFADLVRKIRTVSSVEDLSLTTNGSLLSRFAAELKEAGLNRVNISLDTVDPVRFRELTCGGEVRDVLAGIEAAIRVGLSPVKINVVLTAAVGEADLIFFQKLVRDQPVAVRFIEYMPSRRCRVEAGMSMTSVTEYLKMHAAGKLAPPKQTPYGCGPAHYLQGEADQGAYGFIAPISGCFCARCNRLRLTADGKLRPCLLADTEIDLRSALRSGATDEEIAGLYQKAVQSKPSSHHLSDQGGAAFQGRGMSQIGG